MSTFNSHRLRWLAVLAILVLIPATYLLSESGKVQLNSEALKLFSPLPAVMVSPDNPVTATKVQLGRMLYYDPRLSANQKISCNTCHPLDAYGAESTKVSTGFKNQKGSRNAPTVYNAAGHFAQFWDGRAPTVEEQAKGPIMNPVEMAMPSHAVAVDVLKSMPEYVSLFTASFPNDKEPVTYNNMALAIGAFERGLVTPSRWDSFLAGNQAALTDCRESRLQHLCRCRMPVVPQRPVCRRSRISEARRRETMARPGRRRCLPGDQGRCRQDGLQGALAAEHREDRPLLPQWFGCDVGPGDPQHGCSPTRGAAH